MISQWQAQYDALMRVRCTTCKGVGACHDATPGAVIYNAWTCTSCKGTGYGEFAVTPQRPPELPDLNAP